MKRLFAVALLGFTVALLFGCAANGPPITFGPATGYTMVVMDSDGCHNIHPDMCPAYRPYWRPGDPIAGPVYWLLSVDNRACIVEAKEFAMALTYRLKSYNCPTPWRARRPT